MRLIKISAFSELTVVWGLICAKPQIKHGNVHVCSVSVLICFMEGLLTPFLHRTFPKKKHVFAVCTPNQYLCLQSCLFEYLVRLEWKHSLETFF